MFVGVILLCVFGYEAGRVCQMCLKVCDVHVARGYVGAGVLLE